MNFNVALTSVAYWVQVSFPVLRVIFAILIAVLCVALTVAVLIQPSASNGNAITGQSDTYYGKNKQQTLEGVLKKLTVILAITVAVIAVLYVITVIVYPGV